MKKLGLIVLCLLCLCGCEFKKNNDLSEESAADKDKIKSEEKGYTLTEYDVPCGLKNVSYIYDYRDFSVILSENKFYMYSKKKFSETDSNCKLLDSNKTYNYIGTDRSPSVGSTRYDLFLANDGNYYSHYYITDNKVEISRYDDAKNLSEYKIGFYYYDNSFYSNGKHYNYYLSVINNTIKLSCHEYQDIDGKCEDVSFPLSEGETVVSVVYPSTYFITNKNIYVVDKSDNDKCDEYVDVPCTYTLKKLDENQSYYGYLNLYNDYEDNTLFLNNGYFITKDYKVYKVELK